MGKRAEYRTEQRMLVIASMDASTDRYQTVDEVFEGLRAGGSTIGRTTVYRTLEKLVAEGLVSKVAGTRGGSAYYKRIDATSAEPQGQLLCLSCGRAFPLDCSMLQGFADHIREHHGFGVDTNRTVLCGTCEDCRRSRGEIPEGNDDDGSAHAHQEPEAHGGQADAPGDEKDVLLASPGCDRHDTRGSMPGTAQGR